MEKVNTKDEDSLPRRSIFSRITLLWVIKYIREGFSKPLKKEQMPLLDECFNSSESSKKAFKLWDEQTAAAASISFSKADSVRKPSILRLIWKLERWYIIVGILFGIVQGILSTCARPILLNYLILAYQPDSSYSSQDAVYLLIAFAAVVFFEGTSKVFSTNIISSDGGTSALSWLIPLVHRKAINLRRVKKKSDGNKTMPSPPSLHGKKTAADNTTTSLNSNNGSKEKTEKEFNEVTLIGNDLLASFELWKFASLLPQAIVSLISGCITLVYLLGFPSVIAFATMLTTLFLNIAMMILSKTVVENDLKAADARLSIMREAIMSIVPVKFMCWEKKYLSLLDSKRNEECKWILRFRLLQVLSITIGRVSPVITAALTFLFMGLNGYKMTPNNIFASLAAFNALRLPFTALPFIMNQLVQFSVSARRINEYLQEPEFEKLPEVSARKTEKSESSPEPSLFSGGEKNENIVLQCRNASFSWSRNASIIIDNMDLAVSRGELIGVVGCVGSGKSSLLSGLIGEANLVSGSVQITSNLGYAPQKPFILSGTVLENILMGRPYNADYLNHAINAAAFKSDLNMMKQGLDSEIGEAGVTLSGGQKQRLAIARAIYSNPELLIVDDALAAVDGKVANTIWEEVFEERKRSKLATICALNQTSFLPKFNLILFLNKDGIMHKGTYESLMESNHEFAEFVGAANTENAHVDVITEGESEENKRKKAALILKTSNNTAIVNGDDLKNQAVSIEKSTFEKSGEKEEAGKEGKEKDGKEKDLFEEDKRHTGAVSFGSMKYYFHKAGGWLWFLSSLLIGTVAYGLMAVTDLWLAAWVSPANELSVTFRSMMYLALSLAQSFFMMGLSGNNACATNRASRNLHHDSIYKLLRGTTTFFEKTPSGRILSRFSGDLVTVDKMFAFMIDDIFQFTLLISSVLVTICYVVPEISPVVVSGIIVYGFAVLAVDRTNRQAKRETNLALSPVMTTMSETVTGSALIHSMGFQDFFHKRQLSNVDAWNRFNHFSCTTVQWSLLAGNFIAFLFSISTALVVYVQRNTFPDVTRAGVALNYSFLVPYFLGIYSMMLMFFATGLTSLERILDYITGDLPQEPAWTLPSDPDTKEWPKEGNITFDDVSMRYRPGLPFALKNVSFNIADGERVGIVGRTGAGKSSLIVLMFRIVDAEVGKIFLDGIDLNSVGLHTARKAISIIPQTPLLIPGTVGHNLDPFGLKSNEEMESALEKVGLDKSVIDTEAKTLSAGEQQLMALARLLLLRCDADDDKFPKLVIMDEPTANIDGQTDNHIQRVIKEEFSNVTIMTIAHRLDTVIQSDRMIVMSEGSVGEIGKPVDLLNKGKVDGILSKMVDALGEDVASKLRKNASI